MSTYIGAVQIGNDADEILIGSTLYGTCSTPIGTAAKVASLINFDHLQQGVTIQVKFTNGNTVHTGVTLQVGNTAAIQVMGSCVCDANQVIAFTYETISGTNYWYSHHNIKGAMPITGGTFTGTVTLNGAPVNDLEAATKKYVDDATSNIAGITGAMHFKGEVTGAAIPNAKDTSTFDAYESGDVILFEKKEYVYYKGATAALSDWILLGDEGSYALKTNTTRIQTYSNWQAGVAPTLGDPISINEVTNWNAGTPSNATVTNGILMLTNSTTPSYTPALRTIPNVTNVGSAASLTVGSQIDVVVPGPQTP